MLDSLDKIDRTLKRIDRWFPKDKQLARAAPKLSRFATDPVGFADWLGVILTEEQREIYRSVAANSETNVQAAHGVGKTFGSAVLVLWWVFAVRGSVVTTAPTENQVKELLWSEIRKLYDKNKKRLGGSRTILTLQFSEEARAYGFTSREYSPDSFQGKHAEKLLLIIDEANGISQEIDDGAASCVTGSQNRLLRIGNPVTDGTPFAKACQLSNIRIPVWSHPNVSWAYQKDPDGIHRLKPEVAARILTGNKADPVQPQHQWPAEFPRDKVPGAVSISWIEKIRIKKGETSSYWESRVEGYFPTDQPNSLVPRSRFLAARARYDADPQRWDALAIVCQYHHGVDVGDGGDPHAIASWRGPVLYRSDVIDTQPDHLNIDRCVGRVKQIVKVQPGSVGVDRTGVGSGVLSNLKADGIPCWGAVFGGAATKPKKTKGKTEIPEYTNWKSEHFWKLHEAFMSDDDVAIAPLGEEEEDTLMEELSAIRYRETRKGQIEIEPKDETKKRLGRSPNAADACMIGFAAGDPPPFDFATTAVDGMDPDAHFLGVEGW